MHMHKVDTARGAFLWYNQSNNPQNCAFNVTSPMSICGEWAMYLITKKCLQLLKTCFAYLIKFAYICVDVIIQIRLAHNQASN